MRKILFRLKIITRWLRALNRAARYKRQRDVLRKHLHRYVVKYFLYKPMPNDLIEVLDEIEVEDAPP